MSPCSYFVAETSMYFIVDVAILLKQQRSHSYVQYQIHRYTHTKVIEHAKLQKQQNILEEKNC